MSGKNINPQRIIWLNILKTLSICTVIMYHLSKFLYSFQKDGIIAYINYSLCTVLCVGVPLFFTVNGALIILSKKEFTPPPVHI